MATEKKHQLKWLCEMGADETIEDTPLNRMQATISKKETNRS